MQAKLKKWMAFKKFELYTLWKAVLATWNLFWNEKGYKKKGYVSFKLRLLQLLNKVLEFLFSKPVLHICVMMV